MGLRVMRATAVALITALATGAALLGGGPATAAAADDVIAPVPIDSPTGSYVVLLDEEPAATYDGGIAGVPPTMPSADEVFDPHSRSVQKYVAHLRDRQREIAADAEVKPSATYQVVLNGFSAQMSPDAAARLAAADGVRAVYPDEIFRPDAASVSGVPAGGVLDAARDRASAETDGAGTVVGVIDTGIAPGNPAFAGERLRAVPGTEPYLDDDAVVFDKADGTRFVAGRTPGGGWNKTDYSTKLIGARFFAEGAEAAGFDFAKDVLSPADRDGHGSRVAGIAAGNADVVATVDDLDLGTVSGVAPAAKIASYKACFVGHDPEVTTDDVCVGSDLLAALDRAVADGVDVIAYAVGGGAASAWAPDDLAFYGAAVAGVFIAVSAGNAGPGASTVQAGAPWHTTVAAATVRAFEATVQLSTGFSAPGVSASVQPGRSVTAPVVYAGDAARAGSADAELCYLGTLDPEAVEGRIVVCERGTNPRAEKSQEVEEAGGVGMILVNSTPDSLDADVHRVPTVHLDAVFRADLLAAIMSDPDVTATLVGENLADEGIPTPQVAAFSGRGPFSGAVDILSPGIAAPGVGILAAGADAADGEPTWDISSGTSLAAPHVAGLAAVLLAADPGARPDALMSALMTTASPTFEADGSVSLDAFAQGAGHVDASRMRDPGLLYLSGPQEWADHLAFRLGDGSATPGTDLNLPSITVPAFAQETLVTRTLTATRPGTYEVAADIPGVDVTVTPATLVFSASGETQEYTVAFRNDSAPVEVWATGVLTWTGEDGTSVRSPLAVLPTSAEATALVTGDGTDGTAQVSIVSGVTGQLALDVAGLAPVELLVDPSDPAPGHSGDATSGDVNGDIAWVVDVPAGSPLARFDLDGSADADLTLTVYRVAGPTDLRYYERWLSTATATGDRVTLVDPVAGSYLVVANVAAAREGSTWDLTAAIVDPRAGGSLTADPGALVTTAGEEARYTLVWDGLADDRRYLGVVGYGDSAVRTIVEVDSGSSAPVPAQTPTVTGAGEVGALLSVDPGEWSPSEVVFSYQWLRDGEPIAGATGLDYRVREADVGTTLSVAVTATERGNVNAGTALSAEVVVDVGSTLDVTVDPYRGTTAQQYAVSVEVTTARGDPATGSVTVWVDAEEFTGILADGRVTFALPAQSRGIHVVVAEYAGVTGTDPSTGVSGFVVD